MQFCSCSLSSFLAFSYSFSLNTAALLIKKSSYLIGASLVTDLEVFLLFSRFVFRDLDRAKVSNLRLASL